MDIFYLNQPLNQLVMLVMTLTIGLVEVVVVVVVVETGITALAPETFIARGIEVSGEIR